MALISGCAKADEADLVGHLTPIIGVGDEEDTVVELIEWSRLKGSRVEYPRGSSWFREFCKARSRIDGIWGHAFAYRGNFLRTCSVSQGGDYLYLLPDLAKEKKCRRLGDEVSLEYVQGAVKDSRTDGFCYYLSQIDYGLTLYLSNLTKSVMNLIGACPAQLNCNFWEATLVCETLKGGWAASGSEKRITAKDFLEYYAVKYVTTTDAGRVWNDNLLWVSGEYLQRSDEEPLEFIDPYAGINWKVSRKESFIDVVAREGTELEAVLKELEISRFKRVASKDDKVRRSQAKMRLAGKTLGSMEEKLSTPELNTPLKLARLNEIPDGPVDMATVSSTIVQNLTKRKAVKRGAAPRSVLSVSVDDSSKRRKEQCRAKAREKMVVVMDDEFKKFEQEKEREVVALKSKEVRAESEAEAERLVTASAISRNNLAGKLYQLRYSKAEIMAFSEGNYEEMEIMDEEEVEEREDGLNVAEKTAADNQKIINQKELDVAREREEQTLLYNAEYAEEYEVLFSQYEDRLDDNVNLSLKLEEAKRQVEQRTATILSRDLALNQLTSKLAELKEKVASGSRYEAELAEYRIRALNEEISDMKCNIRTLNEQLFKREIELDTARTNLAVSEADFEKLSSSIMGKNQELRNSAQIRDSLIVRLDRMKVDLRRLKGREAQSRADLAKIQAKNKSLVDDLAHAHRNVRRAVQCEKEMNKKINQLCARISESEQELRVRKMKYQKDLKFELDKRDGEIASGEGSREMKEFLR
ncbi:hypothetical protein GIB67_029731 [Kingdonia uniflora]|uniref:Uncharacterized protein n=1 Tax=Kingdonia uniflora TaxID=39325 RepID=A0A7J7LLY5_9MAGN|nr:hypothetical protein GIB67_029731 [Kingdonia uniflora]